MTERPERLAGYRHRRDHFFAEHPHSPLSESQRSEFSGLDYFPESVDLALNLPLDESGSDVGEVVNIPTSDGKTKTFTRAGRVRFEVDGVPAELTVFKDSERGSLFIPFRDASPGGETYEVGRYLEPQARPDGTLDVDFNFAYNPFCAYGEGWSCPIPPEENRLAVNIAAGEKAFSDPGERRPRSGALPDSFRSHDPRG
jgi:uncharacterized protein (DUF1684 family)